jgi:hypothetical protein
MVTEESKQFFCFLLGGDRAGGKGMCGRFMSPALETQSMREIRLLCGRLSRARWRVNRYDLNGKINLEYLIYVSYTVE